MSTEPSAPPSAPGELAAQWIGRVIDDRYRIVEVLGEGGMGAVFVAEHLKLRKQVAVKTIRAEFARERHATDRFKREVLVTGQIDHPHVAIATDCGELEDGGAFLVIQLVRGESLARRLERGPMPWRQAAELGAQIADALAACHARGVIHRDLKPDNILLEQRDDGSMHARIVDFGIARWSGDATDEVTVDATQPLTHTGAIIGTPGYMAPEQAVGQQIDHRVDVYALGVILWECCTGRRLWQGDTLTAMLARQLAGAATPLRELLPGQVPDALSDLTAQLIAPTPDQRPAITLARDELRRFAFGGDSVFSTGQDLRLSSQQGLSQVPTAASWQTTAPVPGARPEFSTPGGTLISGPPGPAGLLLQLRALAIRRPRETRYAAGALALLVLLLVYRCGRDSQPDPAPAVAQPAPAEPAKATKSKGKDKDKDSDKGEDSKPAAKPEPKPEPPAKVEPPPTPPADVTEVPEAFAEAAQTILTSTASKPRKKAAEAITAADEATKATIPEYVRNLAWLEKLARCEDKRGVLLKIEEAADARVLTGLKTFSKLPKKTCGGWFNSHDCLECLRVDLGRVIGKLEATEG